MSTTAGHYTPITKKLWGERLSGDFPMAEDSSERTSSASLVKLDYRFSTDEVLRSTYINPWGKIRIGNILEDLDSLAGSVAFRHSFTIHQPAPLLVTAAVDEIKALQSISISSDVTIEGSVVWTGRSALDIRIALRQENQEKLSAIFSFVHLDPTTTKATPVVQLKPTTEPEVKLAAERERLASERKAARRASEDTVVSVEARRWMDEAMNKAKRAYELPSLSNSNDVLISATSLTNTFIAQPQQQNTRGRIFGGFLMRRAYELGFASAYTFCGGRPSFVMVDEVAFKKPVEIGDLLRFRSRVLHTTADGLMWIEVEALVCSPEKATIASTNSFLFVFRSQPQEEGRELKRVIPSSEEEALKSWQCLKTS